MLAIENLRVVYHDVISVLNGISLTVQDGEILVIIGANGAGKTTLLRTVAGMIDFYDGDIIEGDIKVDGASIKGLDATDIMKRYRLTYVMEDRPVFWYLTIEENLGAASFSRWDKQVKTDMDRVFDYFPALGALRHKKAGYASGGEQQMLAIGMALMTKPKILLLDEPSLGLAPLITEELFRIIKQLNDSGISIVLVEQNAHAALDIGTRGYVIELGRIVLEGKAEDLIANKDVREFYLGSGEKETKELPGRQTIQEAKAMAVETKTGPEILVIKGLKLSFGGLQILNEIDLSVHRGEIFCIIGPNGAGKTSLLNCINAHYRPQGGEILFKGKEITSLQPHQVAGLGIARTFQKVELFQGMTVLDNIKLGRHGLMKFSLLGSFFRLPHISPR